MAATWRSSASIEGSIYKFGERCRPQDTKTQMMLDSDVSGKNVTIVRPKEAVHPTESVADLKELPTIMQYDIDAPGRVPSKEIVYMKTGEAARPSENKR